MSLVHTHTVACGACGAPNPYETRNRQFISLQEQWEVLQQLSDRDIVGADDVTLDNFMLACELGAERLTKCRGKPPSLRFEILSCKLPPEIKQRVVEDLQLLLIVMSKSTTIAAIQTILHEGLVQNIFQRQPDTMLLQAFVLVQQIAEWWGLEKEQNETIKLDDSYSAHENAETLMTEFFPVAKSESAIEYMLTNDMKTQLLGVLRLHRRNKEEMKQRYLIWGPHFLEITLMPHKLPWVKYLPSGLFTLLWRASRGSILEVHQLMIQLEFPPSSRRCLVLVVVGFMRVPEIKDKLVVWASSERAEVRELLKESNQAITWAMDMGDLDNRALALLAHALLSDEIAPPEKQGKARCSSDHPNGPTVRERLRSLLPDLYKAKDRPKVDLVLDYLARIGDPVETMVELRHLGEVFAKFASTI
ncbi:hypothetical protein BCR34DRAFT_620312 [Clohesyomyces aquaticus]|uniref:Uncharacterized protein n=1 Tax=Clohesyomyces aquaticus TaxID=1231657 RepID=A0A1Y1Y6J0_9PLEO|nr:hypothetical protein BCR34DRAFT_620312 [Clohesyomyces aquaticus]